MSHTKEDTESKFIKVIGDAVIANESKFEEAVSLAPDIQRQYDAYAEAKSIIEVIGNRLYRDIQVRYKNLPKTQRWKRENAIHAHQRLCNMWAYLDTMQNILMTPPYDIEGWEYVPALLLSNGDVAVIGKNDEIDDAVTVNGITHNFNNTLSILHTRGDGSEMTGIVSRYEHVYRRVRTDDAL